MKKSWLHKPARPAIIRRLHQDGLLNEEAFAAACSVLQPNVSEWFLWARQMLLHVGSTLALTGIIYFFAYNWANIGRFVKFGLIEAGIVICIASSSLRGQTQFSGKVFLLSASVLVGVLLAVYGQIYQTGADAFELFVGWAALILGWVIISEFAALWLLWLALLNAGAMLYWNQVGHPAHAIRYEFLCLAVAVLNGAALVCREAGVRQGFDWLNGGWLRGILLSATLVALSLPAIGCIVDFKDAVSVFAVLAWAAAAAGWYACYRFQLRDMHPLSLIVMNLCVILLTLIGKILFHNLRHNESGYFLLFALIIIGTVSGAAFWLRITAAAMSKETKEPAL